MGENLGELEFVALPPVSALSCTMGFPAASERNSLKPTVQPILCLTLRLEVLWAFPPSLHNFSLFLGYRQDKTLD